MSRRIMIVLNTTDHAYRSDPMRLEEDLPADASAEEIRTAALNYLNDRLNGGLVQFRAGGRTMGVASRAIQAIRIEVEGEGDNDDGPFTHYDA